MLLQSTVDSSQELLGVLEEDLPQLLQQRSEREHLTLVVVDGIIAFLPIDRACSMQPVAPKQPAAAPAPAHAASSQAQSAMMGTNLKAHAPEAAWTVQRVHQKLAQATKALLRYPCVTMLVHRSATEIIDGVLQPRQSLPQSWQVRTCVACIVTGQVAHAVHTVKSMQHGRVVLCDECACWNSKGRPPKCHMGQTAACMHATRKAGVPLLQHCCPSWCSASSNMMQSSQQGREWRCGRRPRSATHAGCGQQAAVADSRRPRRGPQAGCVLGAACQQQRRAHSVGRRGQCVTARS